MPLSALRQGLYDKDVDFDALALLDEDFAAIYKDGRVDLQDPAALQQLTKSLLKRDFRLMLELPDDRLCPPVPVRQVDLFSDKQPTVLTWNRYNYIAWLTCLLDTTESSFARGLIPGKITGLDVGTGASCIYPLIGCSVHSNWTFHATDIDTHSLDYASTNIERNDLSDRIHLHRTSPDDPLIALSAIGVEGLNFTMCNPPFYDSTEELQHSHSTKSRPPHAVCTGAEVEMITPGGDAGFVLRMVEESVALGLRVRWYSSMLGKLSSVYAVVARLRELSCGNWAVTTLRAGRKTRRWAVAWSWGSWRPRNDVARGEEVVASLLPHATEQTVREDGDGVAERLNRVLGGLNLRWEWDESASRGWGEALGNVWSRAARRKRARQDLRDRPGTVMASGSEVTAPDGAFGFEIELTDNGLDIRWRRGLDPVLFESFCGMLKQALKQ